MRGTSLKITERESLLCGFIYLLINIPALMIGLIVALAAIPTLLLELACKVISSAVLTAIEKIGFALRRSDIGERIDPELVSFIIFMVMLAIGIILIKT